MNNIENKNILSDDELNAVVESASKATENLEVDVRDIEVEVNPDAPLEPRVITISGDKETPTPIDILSDDFDPFKMSDEDLFAIAKKEEEKEITEETINSVKDEYNLSDEDAYKMLELIRNYKDNPNYPVYANMPEVLRKNVRAIAAQSGVGFDKYNMISRMVLDEFIKDAKLEESFIDLEKSLDEALNIPSIVDMYGEHTKQVMEVDIPKMVEEIRGTEPEKAELLDNVRIWFTKAYTFSHAREAYKLDSKIRKAVRRGDHIQLKRATNEMNYANSTSKFIMNDSKELSPVLNKVLITDVKSYVNKNKIKNSDDMDKSEAPSHIKAAYNLNITPEDIDKFVILICSSAKFNPDNIVYASYMYYLMKNIITLKMANEAKTDFAVELINNICETITFIRDEEAEFNAEYIHESKPRKKPDSKSGKRK